MNIKEIATLANTSPASVSRVINSSGYVKEEVRQRVQKILDDTGYRPNAFAKALHSKKSHTIGVILPKINATSSSDNVLGIDEYFSAKGYSLLLANTNHSLEKELEFLDVFKQKQVDGIILIATELTKAHQHAFAKLTIPLVIMGQTSLDDTPCVLFDEIQAAYRMTEYLIEHGHQRIAFIGVDERDIAVGQCRKQGYLNALQAHNLVICDDYYAQGDFTPEGGYKACQQIIQTSSALPHAIFAANDKMAIGAINYLMEQNIRVPEQISVCGVGGGLLAQYYNPKLTTLFYDYKQSGMIAAQTLYRLIHGDKNTEPRQFVPHQLVVSDSTRSVR